MTFTSGAAFGTRLAMVAGESSGDIIAGGLLRSLKKRLPINATYVGVGGSEMIKEGLRSILPLARLSVIGHTEALRRLPSLYGARRRVIDLLCENKPSVYIGIDSPDFNLGIEKIMRRNGVPTIHFASPSVWAWRRSRLKAIKESVDHMLCLFPFEVELYADTGVTATYIGHPLADEVPMVPNKLAARVKLGMREDDQIIVLMPGSRVSEVLRHGPLFFAAAKKMLEKRPSLKFILPLASQDLQPTLAVSLLPFAELPLVITQKQAALAIEASDAALVAAGTASLEVALYKKPMVIAYSASPLTAWIMRFFSTGHPYVGLPNVLANRALVPEVLQERVNPHTLAEEMLKQLEDSDNRARLSEEFTALHEVLRAQACDKASDLVIDMLRTRRLN